MFAPYVQILPYSVAAIVTDRPTRALVKLEVTSSVLIRGAA